MPAPRALLPLLYSLVGLPLAAATSAPATLRFDFGAGPLAADAKAVAPDTLYTRERGYGLLAADGVSARASAKGGDALRGDALATASSFLFVADLPEGDYDVTVLLGAPDADSETTVKAETRRLMLERVRVPAGKT